MVVTGQAVAPGIGVGPAFLLRREHRIIPPESISEGQVQKELANLAEAMERARNELSRQRDRAARRFGDIVARIFETHLMFLDDEPTFDEVRRKIEQELESARYALYSVLEQYAQHFEKQEDPYFRDRAQDVRDVCRRLIARLDSDGPTVLADVPEKPSILLASELTPSDILHLPHDMIIAVASEAGGSTSHTAILTRTLGVPSVVGVRNLLKQVHNGEPVIVNGNSGKVVLQPDEDEIEEYRHKQAEYREFVESLEDIRDIGAETLDGKRIRLLGNIEMPAEVSAIIRNGAEGVGLFRTEYLVLTYGGLPGEEVQFGIYRDVVEALDGQPVTFRTFDLGGDKVFPGAGIPSEDNPFLGWRAIRVALDRPDMMRPQLRAILRASAYGRAKLMFPMIGNLEELHQAKEQLHEVQEELRGEGIPFDHEMPVGMMVEIPSAAILADKFAPHVDFFSIGTNDLIQFVLAVDRSNEQVAPLHQPFHPAVLQLMKLTCDAGRRHGKPVSICGEMAGQPLATLLLIGLGLDELSTSPTLVPEVKKLILSASREDAEQLTEAALGMNTATEVREHILEAMKERFRNLPIWFGD